MSRLGLASFVQISTTSQLFQPHHEDLPSGHVYGPSTACANLSFRATNQFEFLDSCRPSIGWFFVRLRHHCILSKPCVPGRHPCLVCTCTCMHNQPQCAWAIPDASHRKVSTSVLHARTECLLLVFQRQTRDPHLAQVTTFVYQPASPVVLSFARPPAAGMPVCPIGSTYGLVTGYRKKVSLAFAELHAGG